MAEENLPTTIPAFFRYFLLKQKWRFLVLFMFPCACVLESNVVPYALKRMVNTVTTLGSNAAEAFQVLAFPIGLFIGAWLCMMIIFRTQEWIATSTIPQLRTDMRMALFDYTEGHSHTYFADNFAGSIASKIGDVPRAASNMLDFIRWRVLTAASIVTVSILWFASVNVRLSVVLLVWVTLHVTISYLFARGVTVYSKQQAEDMTRLHGNIVDSITNISAVRLFARRVWEKGFIRRWQTIEQESARLTAVAMFRARTVMDSMLITMLAIILLTLTLGWQKGWVTPGDIVFVVFSVFNVIRAAWQLGVEMPNFFNEIGIFEQALTIITRKQGLVDVPDAQPLQAVHGEIKFKNVHFNYIRGRDIFRDKNITIPAGQKVGLVGFSGSGKSTFVNLILRLYDLDNGRILIDGQDIAKVTQDSLRSAIAMIPQDSTLFHRSLMENIRYGRVEASDAEVLEASKLAHCHEFIGELKEGYEALVGERGIKLSGGQRQRIAIARAILKNAPILILDEATSSLDSVTEKYIQESLNMLMQQRTTIVVAHRLSTLANMDRILVFKGGTIVEDGTHQSLLATGGRYAMLWNMQAGGFLPEEG